MKSSLNIAAAALMVLCMSVAASAAEVTVDKTDKGARVKIDGQLFTEYLTLSGHKPVLYPVIGPTGKSMTRAYPIAEAREGEKKDHIHHRSLFFTHGDVNGISFWHEGGKAGKIIHKEFKKLENAGSTAVIQTVNDWLAPDGKKLCEDVRTLTFGGDDGRRWIDFDITIKAADAEVTFGDTKEGSFGVRVAGTMKVEAGKGGKIVNSEGQTDKAAWGKAAAWVDYHGPVEGETLGVAILNHPSSFRHPTRWHVRTYGLFAANVFGLKHFAGEQGNKGAHTLKPGDSITFRHRVLLHKGDEKEGKVAEAYKEYAKLGKP